MAVTPGRETVVTFDTPTIDNIQEPAYLHELSFEQISKDEKLNSHMTYVPGVGWQIASYNSIASFLHEGEEADPGVEALNLPTGFSTFAIFKRPDDLASVGVGSLKASGDQFNQKRVADDDNWNDAAYRHSADQSSYASPDTTTDYIAMDRVGITTTNHLPNEKIVFRFFIPGFNGQAKQTLISIFFSGLATRTFSEYQTEGAASGKGQYCLKMYGDGQAKLWERLTDETWRVRHTLRWTQNSQVVGNWHFVTIASDAKFQSAGSKYVGTRIGFQFQSMGNLVQSSVALAVAALGGPEWQFYVPERYEPNNTSLVPIRIDVRRDVRALFQVSRAIHFPEGELRTITFGLPFIPMDTTVPIRFDWYGDIPGDAAVDVQLYDASDDTALTVTDSGSAHEFGGYKYFTPIYGKTRYYAILTNASNASGRKTPTLRTIRLVRNAVFADTEVEEFAVSKKDRISITGPSGDPSHEMASLVVHDRSGTDFPLYFRADMPMRIEAKYDPADATKTTTLFQGRAIQAKTDRRPRKRTRGFKGAAATERDIWRSYAVTALGEWKRLFELQLPRLLDYSYDQATLAIPQPKKVTDVIREALYAYYPISMVDVPDINIRLIVPPGSKAIFEMYTEVGPLIADLAKDYLGGYFIFDANATNEGPDGNKYGCWRLKIPPRPPYVNLAEFLYESNATTLSSAVNLDTFVSTTDGDQTIKRAFIRYGTLREWIVPPEGNYVLVQGATTAGVPGTPLAAGQEGQYALQESAINWVSARFSADQPIAPDPTHPDYLGRIVPIVKFDPGLTSQNAVKLMCRRTYDMACHAQKRLSFEGPVVLVTDASDDLQIRPRKLQFGDPVLVNGEQFIVESCNVDYSATKGGDRIQMAVYELFSVPALNNYDLLLENMVQCGLSIFGI